MKNVDELYENYYSADKKDYDAGDVLIEAKKKEFNYKQFELFDETDERPKLDEETKKKLRRLKIEKRELIKGDL